VLEVMVGNGEEIYFDERSSWSVIVLCYLLMFLSKKVFLMILQESDLGEMPKVMSILLKGFTKCHMMILTLRIRLLMISFGISLYLWWSPLLLDWWLMLNPLLTKNNLVRHGMFTIKTKLCVGGCGVVEYVQHVFYFISFKKKCILFYFCPRFNMLKMLVVWWLRVSCRFSNFILIHAQQFGNLLSHKKIVSVIITSI